MANQIDFYFDFMSPYAYLASSRLPELARKYDINLCYHVIDVPGAKRAAGNFGPSNREVPTKRDALNADVQRWARRYGIPLQPPPNFDCTAWNIAVFHAQDHGAVEPYVTEAYARIWGQGLDPRDLDELAGAATAAGLDGAATLEFALSQAGRERFAQSCRRAHVRGVFGAPIMIVGDALFWGNDRLSFVEEQLAGSRKSHDR